MPHEVLVASYTDDMLACGHRPSPMQAFVLDGKPVRTVCLTLYTQTN